MYIFRKLSANRRSSVLVTISTEVFFMTKDIISYYVHILCSVYSNLTVTFFLSDIFFQRYGERKTMVQITGAYANPIQNGSLSKLDDWSKLYGRYFG